MEALTEIFNSIAFEIAAIENRQRKRTAEAQHHFEYAIESILKDVWKGTAISPNYESSIHRRANWYSSNLLKANAKPFCTCFDTLFSFLVPTRLLAIW